MGEGVERRNSHLPEVIVLLGNSVRPRAEFLIGAAWPCLSISFVSFVRVRNMANSVESDVVSCDSALKESLKHLCELGMSRSQITNGAKRRNFHTGIRKRSVDSATYWVWEKLNIYVKWGWLAYTTSTVRDICTFAVLCSVTWPFLSLHSCSWRALHVV